MKKLNRNIKDKTNLMLFLLMSIFTLTLTVGYSAINSELTVSGEANFRIMEGTRITNVSLYETTNSGIESYKNKYSSDSITLGVDLQELESTVTYKVEVTNFGTVASIINNIETTSNSNASSEVELIGYNKSDFIYPGDIKEIYIKIKYKDNVSTLPNITDVNIIMGFSYVVPESTLAEGSSSGGASGTFFYGTMQKTFIESIEFLPTLEVGDNALGFWDASYQRDNSVVAWYTDINSNSKYELHIGGNGKTYAPVNSSNLFSAFNRVTSIEFGKYFDTSNVSSMSYAFSYCNNLLSLNLSNWNTIDVISLEGMFFNCSSLASIDLSSWDTSNVTSMTSMFRSCSKLTNLDIRNFSFSKVSSNSLMFYSVPASAYIVVKSNSERNWILARNSNFTNIKTIAELEEL